MKNSWNIDRGQIKPLQPLSWMCVCVCVRLYDYVSFPVCMFLCVHVCERASMHMHACKLYRYIKSVCILSRLSGGMRVLSQPFAHSFSHCSTLPCIPRCSGESSGSIPFTGPETLFTLGCNESHLLRDKTTKQKTHQKIKSRGWTSNIDVFLWHRSSVHPCSSSHLRSSTKWRLCSRWSAST